MSLLSLPNELLLLIGESIDAPQDLISFVKTCLRLSRLLRSHLPRAFVQIEHHVEIPLYWGAATGNETLVREALLKRAFIFIRDSDPNWLYHHPNRVEPMETLVARILKVGAKIIVQNFWGHTALDTAAFDGRERVVKLLLGVMDPKTSFRSRGRDVALNNAYEKNYVNVSSMLLATAHPHFRNIEMKTPLHMAVEIGNEEAIKALAGKGASIKARDNIGRTPLHYAVEIGKVAILKLLINSFPDALLPQLQFSVFLAKKMGREEIARYLYYECFHLTGVDGVYARTKLHMAVEDHDEELVAELLDKGASVTAKDINGRTPLHLAAKYENTTIIDLLIKNSSNVSAKDYDRKTPLHMAVRYGVPAVVSILLQEGTDIDAQDCNTWTPLDVAIRVQAHGVMHNLLLENGARFGSQLAVPGKEELDPKAYSPKKGVSLPVRRSCRK